MLGAKLAVVIASPLPRLWSPGASQRFRKVLSNVGGFVNLRGGNVYPEGVLTSEKTPIRSFCVTDATTCVEGAGAANMMKLETGSFRTCG